MATRCKYSTALIFDLATGKFIAFDTHASVEANFNNAFIAHPNNQTIMMVIRCSVNNGEPALFIVDVCKQKDAQNNVIPDKYWIRASGFHPNGCTVGGIKLETIAAGDHPFPPADATFVCSFAAAFENFIEQAARTESLRNGGSAIDKMAKAQLADLSERSSANHPLDRSADVNIHVLLEIVKGTAGLEGAKVTLNAAYPDFVGGKIAWYYSSKAVVVSNLTTLVLCDEEPSPEIVDVMQLHLNICRVAKQCRSRDEFDTSLTKLLNKVSVAPSTARQAIGDMNTQRTKNSNNSNGFGRNRGTGQRGGKGFFSGGKGPQCFKCQKFGHRAAECPN
mmetsp:Transcript_23530/g.72890  ORF Transcript_23530/g.72890 Transcript_23530/m.72890 type:complete len:335 (-) Transcript_23530:66-1070(-)